MVNIVEELKQEHASIVEALDQVRKLGVGTQEGKNILYSAKNGLLAHLEKEDKKLYPVLRKEAGSNDALKSTLDTFASEMDRISQTALRFFEKYQDGGSGLEFAQELGTLFATLGTRIRREENILFEEFRKIAQ